MYSQDGRRLPLVTRTPLTDSNVYSFASPTAELVFEGLDEEPTPAFLDDFSAPIKLIYDYSDEALLTLLTHSLDGFTRWDASQQLLARSIKRAMDEPLLPIPSAILNGYRSVAQSEVIEPALKSRLLMLPAVADLINQHPKLAIHQLLDAIQHVEQQLARALRDDVLKHYQQNEQADYLLSADAMGKRALRTSCLNWIAIAEPSLANDLCLKQYQDANNMTDTLAALQVANKHSLPVRQELMNDFYQAWHQDGLVMDKWLQLQGSWDHPDCMENLQRVLEDPVFSLKNPNRTRALLSGFYAMNPRQFHAKDGRGYGWLADKIEQLNGINPQVAARMISPLTQWQRFEKAQGDLMKAELKQLRDMPSLSPDLEESIDKSLNQADV